MKYQDQISKYPRTHHIQGSRLQAGDEDLQDISFSTIAGCNLVVEEKVDGANCGVSFSDNGELLLQSRGHYLTGGYRERHFNLFKQWANAHASSMYEVLGTRYVMYGEWLYAKHTIFYNALPHYFMEFDILDRETGEFLDTPTRQNMLRHLPVVSVRVLHEGILQNLDQLKGFVGDSAFIDPGHLGEMQSYCEANKLNPDRALKETDSSNQMEGLYIKHEENGVVKGRYKWVRWSFLSAVFAAEGHWLNRPIIPNRLQEGVELFG